MIHIAGVKRSHRQRLRFDSTDSTIGRGACYWPQVDSICNEVFARMRRVLSLDWQMIRSVPNQTIAVRICEEHAETIRLRVHCVRLFAILRDLNVKRWGSTL